MFDWKKIGIKMVVTFGESLLGALVVLPVMSWTRAAMLAALAGAVGAVLSLVYNLLVQYKASMSK
jgi:hypothetical protein